jgi:GT2 family glycosyltransferase
LITELPATPILPVDFISGSVALVRAALLREVGLLDEDYFFNTEVADHCHRSREVGYLTVVDSRARANHNLDRSSALRSTLHVYYIIRNRFVYVRKRYRAAKWPLTLVWAIYCLLLVGKLRLSGKGATAQAVYLGLVDGVSKRWGGQNSRVLTACGQGASQVTSQERTPQRVSQVSSYDTSPDKLPGASQTGQ